MINQTQTPAMANAAMGDALADMLMGQNPDNEKEDVVDRNPMPPEDPARRALVTKMIANVKMDRDYWESRAFNQMRRDQRLAAGKQWPEIMNTSGADTNSDRMDDRYQANIVLRHIHQRTATIYGKNPKIVARRKKRILNTVWDGTHRQLEESTQALSMDPTGMMPGSLQAMAILMDADKVRNTEHQLDGIAKTLELVFEHDIDEQTVPFKVQMKALIRKGLTCGVAYAKLGYQRIMQKDPDTHSQIRDASQQLAALERLSADVADGVVSETQAETEQLRLLLQTLQAKPDIIVREGLTVSYPDSTAIIPHRALLQLRGFIGADYVTEEFFLTRDKIQEIYDIDVKANGITYTERLAGSSQYIPMPGNSNNEDQNNVGRYCVWVTYNKIDGMVYTMCDGYPDFLCEPHEPEVYLERFYPWFPFVVNEVYAEGTPFPPSDVSLIKDMQFEINRSRQSLREHRRAARPRTVTRKGLLSESDKTQMQNGVANAVIELTGLAPGEKVDDFLQPWSGPNINPALYDTGPAFEDMLRVIGSQEANFGGTSNATATESSIAEGSRATSMSSTIDDLDEFLTEFCRAGGQVILNETSVQTVQEIVGPGAVWPEFTKEQVAKEIYLDIEAGSTGRPNKAQEVQSAQQIMPLLMQIPGISPEWIARELIRRMDDRLDLSDAFAAGLPSIQAMNQIKQMGPPGGQDPNAQGAQGANNAPSTKPPQVNTAPRPPEAPPGPPPGAAGGMG
jgi:hypothetical protein